MGLKNFLSSALNDVNQGGLPFALGYFPETGPRNRGVWTPGRAEMKTWGPNFLEVPRPEGFGIGIPRVNIDAGGVQVVTGYTGRGAGRIAELTPFSAMPGYKGSSSWAYLGPTIALGFSAWWAYKGYKGEVSENAGFRGAFDAVTQDVAANTAMWKHGFSREAVYGATKDGLALGTVTRARTLFGSQLLGMGVIGLGAYTGAGIGQSVAGLPGAFAGAWAGGRMLRNPLALLAIGGAYVIGRGAYDILKTGYRKAQSMKGMDTAGDTAAFFTRNITTMRGRAVEAIQKSHLNARSALGQEASFMHMPRRDYFSKYR